MYNKAEMEIAPCECNIGSVCIEKKQCDCKAYCSLYVEMVKAFTDIQCVTISPNTKLFKDQPSMLKDVLEEIRKLGRHCINYLGVIEYESQAHFHIIFDVKDRVKFNNYFFHIKQLHNSKKHNVFHNKLHYLFKDVSKTYKEIGQIPIFEMADLQGVHERKMAEYKARRLEEKLAQLDYIQPKLPKWFDPDRESSEDDM